VAVVGALIKKLLDVALVGFGVLGRQDGGAGGEAVAESVLRRTLFARFGARAGGVRGVGAVGGGALFQPALDGIRSSLGCCCHWYTSVTGITRPGMQLIEGRHSLLKGK
jgi:hypothetical protein